jgi:hypothetical protein
MNDSSRSTTILAFEAWPGTLGSLAGTPDRRPQSIRRVTSIQTIWPGDIDLASDLSMIARGQDVMTAADGAGMVMDDATIQLSAEGAAHTVTAIRADPPLPGLDDAIDASLMSGFRKALGANLTNAAGSVLGLLLDDLPAAMVVAASVPIRYGIETTGLLPEWMKLPGMGTPYTCLGHRTGGEMEARRMAGAPLLGQGPPAGDIARPDDPLAWPETVPMPPHSMRRLRRIDVSLTGDELIIDTHFRDSYMEGSGVETSVHEYEVAATAGAEDRLVRTVAVRPRVLPGPECPQASASAQHVIGQPLEQLRKFVRAELRGDVVCPHLNDQLRALADVPSLTQILH